MSPVSDALAGKSSSQWQNFGTMKPMKPLEPMDLWNHKGKPVHWEGAFGKLFMGIAFMVVSIVLAVSGRGTSWWFWMLIPAFSMLGAGIAQIMQLRKNEKRMLPVTPQETRNNLKEETRAELPSSQTDYVSPDSRYKTGDLAAPPSVTEGTTRHLEMDSEGETMTLPKPNN